MKFKLISDSGSNQRILDASIDYTTVPLTIVTDEKTFVDDSTLDVKEMVTFLSSYKGKSGTACPGVADWLEAFGDAEYIFCFTITSNLSGCYNAAGLAKEDYESAHPDRHVHIVDSLSAGPEMKILIEKALEYIAQGNDYKEICEKLEAYKQQTGLMFSLESLQNLANNGRVSAVTAKLAGVLGIRVVGKASDVGTLEPMDKCRGEKKALLAVWKHMKEMGFVKGKVRIDHCCNLPAAEQLKDMILEESPEADIIIGKTYGLCSFYAEKGGLMIGFEKL